MNRAGILTRHLLSVPLAGRAFLALCARLRTGGLRLQLPDGGWQVFGDAKAVTAELQLRDWRACTRILAAGDIGFAEAWRAGWVFSPDPTALLRLALRNEAVTAPAVSGGWLQRLWFRLRHGRNANTRAGSRRNIHAHYDIGNAFYALWLDAGWTYSSALFGDDRQQSLESAQTAKYDRIVRELGLSAGDRVLEIGCGWGGFAEHAARLGIAVHGVTLSTEQLAFAQQRIAEQRLDPLVQLELRDYRDLDGQYDAVVSIEMFEAVGERYWSTYFDTVRARLRAGGQALVQSITIADDRFAQYRSGSDFIQQYIFPGGMLPSPSRFRAAAERAGLRVDDGFSFGPDYAETLRRWHAAFDARRPQRRVVHAQAVPAECPVPHHTRVGQLRHPRRRQRQRLRAGGHGREQRQVEREPASHPVPQAVSRNCITSTRPSSNPASQYAKYSCQVRRNTSSSPRRRTSSRRASKAACQRRSVSA